MTSTPQLLDAIARQLPEALLADRIPARKTLQRLRHQYRQGKTDGRYAAQCAALADRVYASAALRRRRLESRPRLRLDPELPITARQQEIVAAIQDHPVVIVAGETGSGKTTQLPKLCLLAGRGVDGAVGITQPRRIAATSVSRRIAQELGEEPGRTVGYKIRFHEALGPETRIKVMTDGVLLAETHHDPFLNHYDTLIVDEAHERSLNIDFILGILKRLLPRRRDLKVIITSATIDTDKFAAAFGSAPVIEVSGRMYPVETRYTETDDEESTPVELAVQAVGRLERERRFGDILIFMPTEQDIRDTCDALEGRRKAGTDVIPLFARLTAAEQQKVFQRGNARRIIVATNVAETSITIPGIQYVIDTGLARISQYAPRTRTTTLPVRPIARSSADQRQGRCGRVANGICIRLYSQEDYENRPRFTVPEILRANLAEVILRMIALGLGDAEDFPFIDPPAQRSIQDGYQLLLELGAISSRRKVTPRSGRHRLTAKGRLMAQLPLDPRLACMLIEARNRDCLDDMAIICSALSIQDPRERPALRQAEADQAQADFILPASDFVTLLRIWHKFQDIVHRRKSWGQVKLFCRDRFLSFRRMQEWKDIYRQILRKLAEHDIHPQSPSRPPEAGACTLDDPWYASVHQSILHGFLSNIALKKEKQIYQASHNRQVMLFPGSGLFKTPPLWLVAAEMVETSRLFARCAAMISPDWLEPVGGRQCKSTYLDPHWERNQGRVVATEQVTLFGLIIARRPRPYGPAHPEEATEIFIRSALLEGDVRRALPFMEHNQNMLDAVEEMEDRLRRRDLRVDDQVLMEFYRRRLGRIYDLRTLEHRIRKAGGDGFLRLEEDDLLRSRPDRGELDQFPDHIAVNRQRIACEYRFAPGEPEDGVTARVPAAISGSIDAATFDWLVPGLLKEKITTLIKGLPKEYRRRLVPLSDTVEIIATELPASRDTGLTNALGRFIHRRFGIRIPATAWDADQLPEHLRMRIVLTDEKDRELKSGRDASILTETVAQSSTAVDFESIRRKWERPVTSWDFGDLPDSLELEDPAGTGRTVFPALESRDDRILLTVFERKNQAENAHPQGVRALYCRRFQADIRFLAKNLQLPAECDAASRYFGGRQDLDRQLCRRVLDDLFLKPDRRADIFHARAEQLEREGIAGRGRTKRRRVIDLLATYVDLRLQLYAGKKKHAVQQPVQTFLDELEAQLNRLVPKNFIQLYDDERLQRLLRYLQAVALRAERGLVNLDKDRLKAARIAPFEARMEAMVAALTPRCSREKRRAIEEFFWLLEEYRISVFAQEIKTAQPVSAKRLEKQLQTIDTLA